MSMAPNNTAWPIGSVFLSVVSTDPATLLGFGTWSRIAEGQFLVGLNSADADFDTAEETGGAKSISIRHNHSVSTNNENSHTHAFTTGNASTAQGNVALTGAANVASYPGHTHSGTTGAGSSHNHTVNESNALSNTQSILPPYFVVYVWKRTA
jgi:hypothetical protein